MYTLVFIYNFITVKEISGTHPPGKTSSQGTDAVKYNSKSSHIARYLASFHNGRLRSTTGRVTVGVQLWARPWRTWLWQGVKWLGSFIQISTMYDSSLKRTIELCHILNGNCCKISYAIVKFEAFKQQNLYQVQGTLIHHVKQFANKVRRAVFCLKL